MPLVLTTASSPGASAWTEATALALPSTPYELIQMAGETYNIPNGGSRYLLFVCNLPDVNIIQLPSSAANPGVTLTLAILSDGSATVDTTGADSFGPYSVGSYTLDGSLGGTPRSLTFTAIPVAAETGLNYWMLVSSE
jgi:hypothetical protein